MKMVSNSCNQSFFRLPLLFIVVFLTLNIAYYLYCNYVQVNTWQSGYSLVYQSILPFIQTPLNLIFYFLTAVLACQSCRLNLFYHQFFIICVIALIVTALFIFRNELVTAFFNAITTSFQLDLKTLGIDFDNRYISKLIDLIQFIVSLVVIYGVFLLVAKWSAAKRPEFELYGEIGQQVYAHTYSLLNVCIFIGLLYVLNVSQMRGNYLYQSVIYDWCCSISLLAAIVVYYAVAYIATIDSFEHIDRKLSIGKLTLTILLVYFFSIIAFICILSVMILFEKPLIRFFSIFLNDFTIYLIILPVLYFVLTQLILFGFGRRLVRAMYR